MHALLTRRSLVSAAALLLTPLTAHAATYAETTDAGDLPATAQVVSGPAGTSLTAVSGTLTLTNGVSEADMYKIYVSSPSTFSASTTGFVPGSNSFDSQLFLFDANGLGVVGNDDSPAGGSQSSIPAGNGFVKTAGLYYLLITGSSRNPASTGGIIFPSFVDGTTDATGVYGPTGPGGGRAINGYDGNSNEGGNYSIALAGAQVVATTPEPACLTAVFAGTLLAGRRCRRITVAPARRRS